MTLLEARNPLIAGMELEWLAADGTRQRFILEGALSEGIPIERIRPGQRLCREDSFCSGTGRTRSQALQQG